MLTPGEWQFRGQITATSYYVILSNRVRVVRRHGWTKMMRWHVSKTKVRETYWMRGMWAIRNLWASYRKELPKLQGSASWESPVSNYSQTVFEIAGKCLKRQHMIATIYYWTIRNWRQESLSIGDAVLRIAPFWTHYSRLRSKILHWLIQRKWNT